MKQLGDTNWSETFTSGNVVQGTACSAGFGSIQSGALESSNVDLTTELVNMITAQRAFQANAQVITTANPDVPDRHPDLALVLKATIKELNHG